MDSRNSVKQTIEEVEALTGCPVQIVQDSSIKNVVKISPSDQQAWFGLAEAIFVQDRPEDADEFYRKAIEIDATSNVADLARDRLGQIAKTRFRSKMPGMERMDAVMCPCSGVP